MRAKCLILLIIPIFCLMLAGCSDYSSIDNETTPSTGLLLTPEAARSIYYEVVAAQTEKYPIQTDTDGHLIVFWTDNGSVWHKSRNCGSIASSKNLLQGSEEDAVAAGKSRVCSICGGETE